MENPLKSRDVSTAPAGDGLGVFDREQKQSYVLNATSALVYQHCDGQTTPRQLAELLREGSPLRYPMALAHAQPVAGGPASLQPQRLARVSSVLRNHVRFGAALAHAVESDVWQKRADFAARRVRDDDWLFEKFKDSCLV